VIIEAIISAVKPYFSPITALPSQARAISLIAGKPGKKRSKLYSCESLLFNKLKCDTSVRVSYLSRADDLIVLNGGIVDY
jgi:hypothetical protein